MENLETEDGIGVLGGSFDPVHLAHLKLATSSFAECCLSKIVFLPAYQAPLRPNPTQTAAEDRLNMLKIALSDFPYPFDVSELEIFSKQICYSVNTAEKLKLLFPNKNLFWIIGSDHLLKLKYWKDIDLLCEKISFICALRPDFDPSQADIPAGAKIKFIKFPPMPYSSTEIRESLKYRKAPLSKNFGEDAKMPPKGLSEKVYNYILEKNLYL